MIIVLGLCRTYSWTLEYVLDLPFQALSAIIKNTERLAALDRVENLRISLASGSEAKYRQKLMDYYSQAASPPRAIPKAVDTTKGFELLRGFLHG